MNAPVIWIFIPIFVAILLGFLRRGDLIAYIGSSFAFILALAAWLLPFDQSITISLVTIKITPSLDILGRKLVLSVSEQPLLSLIYGSVSFWFLAASTTKAAQRLVPYGLAITALFVASIAVEPFLYAALLIEIAVLIAIPMLSQPGDVSKKGLLRFLILQSLAMLFILFSGWLLAGIEASPSDLNLALQAAAMLGIGFALLVAIFPFFSWIPMLAEDSHPYIFGFTVWIFPAAALLFGLGFLDHYTWLRESQVLFFSMRSVGFIMIVLGGLWAAFQNNLGKIFAYAAIVEIGLSLIAISFGIKIGVELFFLLIVPRVLGFGVWALSLTKLKNVSIELDFKNIKGLARGNPIAAMGVVLSNFSIAGIPLLAGFPVHQAILNQLSNQMQSGSYWYLVGIIGLIVAAMRSLSSLVNNGEAKWEFNEPFPESVFLVLGWIGMLLMGIFPQWLSPLIEKIPMIFDQLGR